MICAAGRVTLNKTMLKISATVLAMGLGIGLAFASADDMIKARQDQMKANGKAMGELVKIMKGESPYDTAAVKAQLDAMGAAYQAAATAGAWSADSNNGATAETWAKPEVWTDAEGFKAAGEALGKAMADLGATTDEAGFKAAFPALGGACKGCHEKFRRPKD